MFLLGVGGGGANKVHYGRSVSGVLMNRRVNSERAMVKNRMFLIPYASLGFPQG